MGKVCVLCLSLFALVQQTKPSASGAQTTHNQRDESNKIQRKETDKPPATPINECVGCVTIEQPAKQNEEKRGKNTFSEYLYNCYLVVAIFGVFAAIATLIYIQKQTKIAGDTAKTALQNTRNLINTERAWVDVELIPNEAAVYKIIIENLGKTPADIRYCRLATAVTHVKNPHPKEYDDRERITPPKALLMSGRKIELERRADLAGLFGTDWPQITDGQKSGWVAVSVDYFDLIAGIDWRKARVIYRFNPQTSALDVFAEERSYS